MTFRIPALCAATLTALALAVAPAAPVLAESSVAARAGFSESRLPRIDAVVQSYVDAKQLAGAVVGVMRNGKLVYLKSFGKQDIESGKPMSEDAIFRIASMTKPVTSVAVMMLVEEGRLLLTDPVSKYIPEFREPQVAIPRSAGDPKTEYDLIPAAREITVLDLLNHTSGISYRFWGRTPFARLYEEASVSDGLTPTTGRIGDMVKALARLPLVHQPGSAYEYGLNTDVLGYLVEVVSGMPLDRFFKERIFDPLGMKDTQFYLSEGQRPRLASLYIPDGKGGIVKAPDAETRWGALVFSPGVPYATTRTYFSGGAGLTSTARDYLRFTQMLVNGGKLDDKRLLGPKTVELMRTNAIGALSVWDVYSPAAIGNLGDKFGLGFGIRSEAGLNEPGSVGEYMWAGIFNTRFWNDPKEKLSIVVMGQLIPRVPDIEARIHAAVYQAIIR